MISFYCEILWNLYWFLFVENNGSTKALFVHNFEDFASQNNICNFVLFFCHQSFHRWIDNIIFRFLSIKILNDVIFQQHNTLLEEQDAKRKTEFHNYELDKEHKRREELKKFNEDERKAKEKEFEEEMKNLKKHDKMHQPVR